MKRTTGIFLLMLLCLSTAARAQRNRGGQDKAFAGDNPFNHPNNEFLQTQWWLGIRGGVNLTQPVLLEPYYVYSPIDYSENRNTAQYAEWNAPAMHLGLDITFYHKGLSVGLQPNYQQQRYTYATTLVWEGSSEVERLQLTYDQAHTVDYLDLPLFVKYDIVGKKVRPFVLAGGYYRFRITGNTVLEVSGVDEASGGATELNGETVRVNTAELYAPQAYGVLGGLGVSFDFWNIRAVLDATYRYGLSNITYAPNRYRINALVSLGEVPDDLSLNNLAFSLAIDFPLRYISKDYAPF